MVSSYRLFSPSCRGVSKTRDRSREIAARTNPAAPQTLRHRRARTIWPPSGIEVGSDYCLARSGVQAYCVLRFLPATPTTSPRDQFDRRGFGNDDVGSPRTEGVDALSNQPAPGTEEAVRAWQVEALRELRVFERETLTELRALGLGVEFDSGRTRVDDAAVETEFQLLLGDSFSGSATPSDGLAGPTAAPQPVSLLDLEKAVEEARANLAAAEAKLRALSAGSDLHSYAIRPVLSPEIQQIVDDAAREAAELLELAPSGVPRGDRADDVAMCRPLLSAQKLEKLRQETAALLARRAARNRRS
jgi:hypothetical protein